MKAQTFYKIQYLDDISLSWKDIQKRYLSKETALDAGKKLRSKNAIRIVEIVGKQRIFGI